MCKRCLLHSLLACFLFICALNQVKAEAPKLSDVFPSNDILTVGKDKLEISYIANIPGLLRVEAREMVSGSDYMLLLAWEVEADHGSITWDG